LQERSSIGRAVVSKTEGWGFDSSRSCQKFYFFMNIVNYFKDTISELKKLTLPSRKEVYVTTATITVVITVFALVVMLADFVIAKIIGLIFGL